MYLFGENGVAVWSYFWDVGCHLYFSQMLLLKQGLLVFFLVEVAVVDAHLWGACSVTRLFGVFGLYMHFLVVGQLESIIFGILKYIK